MARFYDNTGRRWSIAFDAEMLARVDAIGMNSKGLVDGTLFTELVVAEDNGATFRRLCWAICRPEADARGIDVAAFYQIVNDSLASAGPNIGDAIICASRDAMPRDIGRAVTKLYQEKTS